MLSRRNDDGSRDSMSKSPFQVPSEVLGGKATPVETKTDHSHTSSGSPGTAGKRREVTAEPKRTSSGSPGTAADVNEIGNGNSSVGVNPSLDSTSDVEAPVSEGVEHDSSSDPQTSGSVGDSSNSDPGTGRDDDRRGEDDADPLAFLNGGADGDELDSDSILDSGDPDGNGAGGSGRGRRAWLWVVIGIVIALLVAGVGVGGYYMMNPPSQKIDNSSKVGGNTIGGAPSSSDGDNENVPERKKFLDDAGVPDFYQVPRDEQSDEERTEATEYALVTEPTNAVGRFMSKSSNPDLTDDPSQYLLEDGSTNPNYSYLTGENTTAVIRDDMERLVNPVYGGWTFLQDDIRQDVDGYPQDVSSVDLWDMFDPSAARDKEGEAGLRDLAKLYADWDSNEYGGEWHGKSSTDPIVGQIVDYNCDYNVTGAMGDTISCTAQVRYTGVITADDGKRTTKSVDKTLELNYKVNYENSENPRRILLTSVEQ